MSGSSRKQDPYPETFRRRASESSATALPSERSAKEDRRDNIAVLGNGLRMERLPGSQLSFEYVAADAVYSWILDMSDLVVVSASDNMPLPLHWFLLRDIRHSSLEKALVRHTKRIEAYALRRIQVDGAVRHCKAWLQDGKIETTGACNYARVDLNLDVTGKAGRLSLELWYEELAVHPVRHAFSLSGSPEFQEMVSVKLDDIVALLQAQPLDEVCQILCA